MKKATSYYVMMVLLTAFSLVFAQTSPSKVGTTDNDRSMNYPGGSTIARAANGEIMMVWGTLAGPDSLVYATSYDDFLGAWNTPVALGTGTGEGRVLSHANIAADADNNFHAVWSSNWNIVHSKYDGSNWSTPVSVTGTAAPWDTLRCAQTAVGIDGFGAVWVIWSTGLEDDNVNEWIFASRSVDDGVNWSAPDTLFKDAIMGEMPNYSLGFPHLATSLGGKVGVTVRGPKGPLGQYSAAFQEYNGTSWGVTEYVVDAAGNALFADSVDIYQLSMDYDAAGDRHFAFYTAEADFDGDVAKGNIYYTKKTAAGVWSDPKMITDFENGSADYPSIVFGGTDDLYVVFFATSTDTSDALRHIYGVNSADLGTTWTGAIQLSYNTVGLDARPPSISQTIGAVGADVAWIEPEGDVYGIYYGLIPKAVVSVDGKYQPETYSLLHNYPNPFNPATTIEFGVAQPGNVKLYVYNMAGQEVAQLVNQKMETGIYEVNFNAGSLASGVYFYRLITSDHTMTNKLIYLK